MKSSPKRFSQVLTFDSHKGGFSHSCNDHRWCVSEWVSEAGIAKRKKGPAAAEVGGDRLEWAGRGLGNPAGDLCAAASLEKHYCARRQRPLRRKLGVGGGVVTLCPAALPSCQRWHHRGSIFSDKLVWAGSKIAMWPTVNRILNKDISSIPPRPLDMPSFDFGLRPLSYYCYKVKLFFIGWLNNLISLEPVINF